MKTSWISSVSAVLAKDLSIPVSADEDALPIPSREEPQNKDQLATIVGRAFKEIDAKPVETNSEEEIILGDWAFSHGNYAMTLSLRGKDESIDGNYLTILRRKPGGSWRIFRETINPLNDVRR